MPYKGRSFYNLLKMNLKREPALEATSWQIENYRELWEGELFKRLEAHQILLDRNQFLLCVDEYDSPEELTEFLCVGDDVVKYEQIFLLVFELWRRLYPHKQSLSLFCDELDHFIEEYEEGNMEHEEELQAALLNLHKILDDYVDKGGKSLQGLKHLSEYSCHDIEVFMYEYIAHQIDIENDLYASELLDGFYPYSENKRWFDFLRVRLVASANLEEGHAMLERLLGSLTGRKNLYLLFEILHFLIYLGETKQFLIAFRRAFRYLETEDDLKELLVIMSDYLSCIEKQKEERRVRDLLEKRQGKPSDRKLGPSDPALTLLQELMSCIPV
jgi:hypothetical protein